jgi:hypothetical protein
MDIIFDGVVEGPGDMVGYSDPDFDGAPEGKLEGRRTLVGWIDGFEESSIEGDDERATEGVID